MDRKEGRGHVGEELVVSTFFRQFILWMTMSDVLTVVHWPTSRSRTVCAPTATSVTSRLQSGR
jgi:hypothetical protein